MSDILWNWNNPLARMPRESVKALSAFHDYEALGPGRSMGLLSKGYRDELPDDHRKRKFFVKYHPIITEETPTSEENEGQAIPTRLYRTLKGWSTKFNWQARLARLLEIRAAQREAVRLVRQIELEEADWHDGNALRERVKELLNELPKFKSRKVSETTGPDGGKVTVITVELNTSIAQLSQGLRVASELQRHATDEPDVIIGLSGGSLLNSLIKELDSLVPDPESTATFDENGSGTPSDSSVHS